MLLFLFEYALQLFLPSVLLTSPDIVPQVASPVATVGPQSTLVISNQNVNPDGYPRPAIVINGAYPAPIIVAHKGDQFKLNVTNSLTDSTMLRSTSIHWHGILQRGSNWADGPVGVNQCPISPNHSFLYEFNATQAGTYWYHSHYGTQYCDGVRGALVIYDPNDPHKSLYNVDNANTVITIGDWNHHQAPSLEYLPTAYATLINGRGRQWDGPPRNLAPVPLSIINVEYGKRYRLRVISITCDSFFTFYIDKHPFTVIEADAESVVPVKSIDALNIYAGQRYSVVIVADQPIGNYWIRAVPDNSDQPFKLGKNKPGVNSAILRYKGAPEVDPAEPTISPSAPQRLLGETQLHPLINPQAPGKPEADGADINLHFEITYDPDKKRFCVNGKSFVPPKVPILLQLLAGAPPEEMLPKGSIFKLPRNKTISISVPSGKFDAPHPFHLHGHSFSVVRSANSTEDPNPGYNYLNPVRRDTVNLGEANSGSNVTIRFRTDNPGPWIFHCHIDWHLEMGLAVVFVEDPEDTPDITHPPEKWHYLCPTFDALPSSLTSISTVSVPPIIPGPPPDPDELCHL